jgi:DNA-binding NarL/FixJ family response regulator
MIRVLLVDDQIIIRQGLKSLLDLKPDIQVVGDAENGEKAIEQVNILQPDVVLMDIRMPGMDGVTATQLICQHSSSPKVLVLTTFDDDEYICQAMQFGAKGYLLKDTPSEELAQAIYAVYKGYTQMGPGLLEKTMLNFPSRSPTKSALPPGLAELSTREREVLRLIAMGYSNLEIAETLHISVRTVKNHVTGILSRLVLRDRTQAAILAVAFLPFLEADF